MIFEDKILLSMKFWHLLYLLQKMFASTHLEKQMENVLPVYCVLPYISNSPSNGCKCSIMDYLFVGVIENVHYNDLK